MKIHALLSTLMLSLLLFACGPSDNDPSSENGDAEKNDTSKAEKADQKGSRSKQKADPWNKDQVMAPSELAGMIRDSAAQLPLIHCIGPSPMIPHSEHFGEAHKDSALRAFRKRLSSLSRDTSLVIYCGCCPFEDCPNIRPAFSLLEEMGFKKHKLLGLHTSLKADWIDPGHPVER